MTQAYSKRWIFFLVFIFLVSVFLIMEKCVVEQEVSRFSIMNFANFSYSYFLNFRTNLSLESPAEPKFSLKPFKGFWIDPSGDFYTRIQKYQNGLEKIRANILKSNQSVQFIHLPVKKTIFGHRDDYLDVMSEWNVSTTIYLKWSSKHKDLEWDSREDTKNIMIRNYYRWTGSEQLCSWIRKKGGTNMNYEVVHNFSCSSNLTSTPAASSLMLITINGKPTNKKMYYPKGGVYPIEKMTKTPESVTYMHIIRYAVVTGIGILFKDNVRLVQNTCGILVAAGQPNGHEKAPIYNEVLVLSQYWGSGFFHRMLETMPKIAPNLDFLRKNKEIKILVPTIDKLMKRLFNILDIELDRLITGTVKGNTIYLPRSTACGFPQVQETQLLSKVFQNYTEKHLNPGKRNKIVMIKRSGGRRFTYHNEIQKMVNDTAKSYGLEFILWSDSPVLPLEDGMRIFHEAIMVVAPHGAGEANLLFSQPGTYVIEGVCNKPHINLCYQRTAYILGHIYHGIMAEGGCLGQINIKPNIIKDAMLNLLGPEKEAI